MIGGPELLYKQRRLILGNAMTDTLTIASHPQPRAEKVSEAAILCTRERAVSKYTKMFSAGILEEVLVLYSSAQGR